MHACMHACWAKFSWKPVAPEEKSKKKYKISEKLSMYACMHACMHAGSNSAGSRLHLRKTY